MRFPAPARHRRPLRGRVALVFALATACRGEPTGPRADDVADPGRAVVSTGDLANFWAAYDAGGKDGDAGAVQRLYLDRASAGLRDFVARRGLTAANVTAAVRAAPRYYAAIRPAHAALLAAGDAAPVVATIRANYGRMRTLYPASVFPPLVLLAGRFSTGGTTSESGMLIGMEFYGRRPDTPVDELTPFGAANVHALDSLPFVVAHEHVHVLQARAGGLRTQGATLLRQAIVEGAADFLGELASGGIINGAQHAWALPREGAVWADFQRDMLGTDVSRWLYNQGSTTSDRPGDLGYFVGYRIAQAYYARATDKAAAIREIVALRDPEALLAASGYAPR